MIYKIDHIGVAVKSIEKALDLYNNKLDMKCTGVEYIETQNVKVAFLPLGESEIELLEPAGEESTVQKYIEKRGEGIHHIAFKVDSLQQEITRLKNLGLTFINEKPSYGAGGAKIVFLHPKSTGGVLVELCER
jgi:methylmalonyl-CoA epimerase